MHGRFLRRTAPGVVLVLSLAVALGCDDTGAPPMPEAAVPLAEASTAFNPTECGTLTGQVSWAGPEPVVPLYTGRVNLFGDSGKTEPFSQPNPHVPVVDPRTAGVGGAIVFLRGVEPRRARPWDLPPVQIQLRDLTAHVLQGEADTRIGFVRRGDSVTLESKQPLFHSLHFRGAAFFTVPFPDADRPCTRRLTRKGVVELSSASGYYWLRAHLFVDDHPYYARTDTAGQFAFPQVPEGHYEVVCWLPDWHEEHHERDPETCLVTRLTLRAPIEVVQPVEVRRGGSHSVAFTVSTRTFAE